MPLRRKRSRAGADDRPRGGAEEAGRSPAPDRWGAEVRGRRGAGGAWREWLSLAATALSVAAVAVFVGYLIGQYAVTLVARPLGGVAVSPEVERELAEGLANLSPARQQPAAGSGGTGPAAGAAGQQAAPAAAPPAPPAPPASAEPPGPVSGGGTWYRVRVGDFDSRAELDRAVAKLEAAAFPALPLPGPPYRVQVGAFRDEERARSLLAELERRGFKAYIVH